MDVEGSTSGAFRLYPKLQQDHIPPPKGWAGISVKIATDLGDLQASLGYPILRAPRFDDDGEPEEGDPRPTVAPSASARCVSPTTLYAGDTVAQGASTDLGAGDETPGEPGCYLCPLQSLRAIERAIRAVRAGGGLH